ncbi:MAG: metallophosphoesterase family protein [Verrucomicrobiales bacterium]|nr:metallophosphoesterase family protein [Verrucomicrobiales bacterium]
MKYAIFGDVHSNLEALEAVLEDAYRHGCSAYACTGDLVGFNANPQECVNLVRSLTCSVVKGEWDQYISGDDDFSDFNPSALHVAKWQRRNVDEDTRDYLRNLPLVISMDNDEWGLVHASLDTPGNYIYITNPFDALTHFSFQFWNVSFYGHTHTPKKWHYDSKGAPEELCDEIVVTGNHRSYAFNPGSVGQPRDGDWRASYMLFDTGERTVELRRVEYDLELAQLKIRQSGVMPPDFGT